MSLAEELLKGLSETESQHRHPVPDTDTHFIIDPYTRQIENTNYNKTVLMRGDHNSERFTFELPRYVDGHDMSLCNRVIVHFDNVGSTISEVHSDVAYTDDLRFNPNDYETVICSWLIRREATQYVGILSFSLQYLCVEDDGTISYEWNTDSYDGIEIRKSKNNGEAAVINYSNVLEQWRSQIFGAGDSVMSNISSEGASQVAAIQNESANQKAAIELKGSDTLATIPDDYTEIYNMASEAVRTKADSIVAKAEGESISVVNASDDYLRGLNIYGKSTQFNTTGRQMIPFPYFNTSETINGVTFKVNGDGSVSATGISTAGINFYFAKNFTLPVGTYTLSYSGNFSGARLNMYDFTTLESIAVVQDGTTTVTFTTSKEYNNVGIYLNTATVGKEFSGTIYPMLEVGNVRSNYEPYTGGMPSPNPDYPQEIASVANPTVSIYGKNLLDIPESYTFNKTIGINVNLPAGNYVLSFDSESHDGAENPEFRFYDNKIWKTLTETTKSHVVKLSKDETKIYLYSNGTSSNASEGVSATVNKLIVSKIDGAYEPYKPVQTFAVNHTLSGIPVTFAGNYTDPTGQQWICDEIDMERGVYIQRIGKVELTGSEYITKSAYKWQKDGMYSAYAAPFTSSDQYGIDIPDAVPWCFATHAKPNSWEWANFDYLDNVGVRKNIIHLSFNNKTLGITTEDSDVTKFEKFKAYLVSQYEAGTPVTVWYPLAIPIETPLSAVDIKAFKELKMNYPNTTLFNDANAYTKVKYNADPKIYIAEMADSRANSLMEEVLNGVY